MSLLSELSSVSSEVGFTTPATDAVVSAWNAAIGAINTAYSAWEAKHNALISAASLTPSERDSYVSEEVDAAWDLRNAISEADCLKFVGNGAGSWRAAFRGESIGYAIAQESAADAYIASETAFLLTRWQYDNGGDSPIPSNFISWIKDLVRASVPYKVYVSEGIRLRNLSDSYTTHPKEVEDQYAILKGVIDTLAARDDL